MKHPDARKHQIVSFVKSIVRILGYCLDASDGQIYFNPSNDFIVITA